MADAADPFNDNTEYKVNRRPDLQVITSGAQIHYSCDWKGLGRPPEVMGEVNGQFYQGPRDGIRWYKLSNQPPTHLWQSEWTTGPLTTYWDLTWSDDPGQYTIIAEIRNSSEGPRPTPTYSSRPQQSATPARCCPTG